MIERSLAPELGVVDVADRVIFSKDGRMSVAFALTALHEPSLADDDFDRTAELAERVLLTRLPENTAYQFLVLVDRDRGQRAIDRALPPIAETDAQSEVFEELRRGRVAELELSTGGDATGIQDRRHFLVATFSPPIDAPGGGVVGWLRDLVPGLGSKADHDWIKTHEKVLAQVEAFAIDVAYALRQLGVGFNRCGDSEIIGLLYEILNPTAARTLDLESLSERLRREHSALPASIVTKLPYMADVSPVWSLLEDDLVVRKEHLLLGDRYVSVVCMKALPDQTSPGCLVPLLQLRQATRYILSFNVEIPDQEKAMRKLTRQATLASVSQSASLLVKTDLKNTRAVAISEQAQAVMQSVEVHSKRILGVGVSIAVYEAREGDLEGAIQELQAVMSRTGMRPHRETYGLKSAVLALLPGGAPYTARMRKTQSDVVANLLPVYGFRAGEGKVPFPTESGTLLMTDLFDQAITPNAHACLIGASGSGKSYLGAYLISANEIASASRGEPRPYTFILDNGASYARWVDVAGGKYVALGAFESASGIDIFEHNPELGPVDEHVSRLQWLLLDLMRVSQRDEERFEQVKAIVEQALKEHIYNGTLPRSFVGFREALKKINTEHSLALIPLVYKYTDGTLRDMFKPNPALAMDPSTHVLCFDFKGLSSHPDRALLALKLVIYQVRTWAAFVSKKRHRTFLLIDEQWQMMDTGAGSNATGNALEASEGFLNESARQGRKENLALLGLTQSLGDYLGSAVGRALITNSATKFIGSVGDELELVRTTLKLTDRQTEQLASLRRTPRYHEFLMLRDKQSDVIRVPADPLSRWIFTTSSGDRAKIADVEAAHPDLTTFERMRLLVQATRP